MCICSSNAFILPKTLKKSVSISNQAAWTISMYEIEKSYHVIFSKVVKRVHKSKWYRGDFRFGANGSEIFLSLQMGARISRCPSCCGLQVPSLECCTAGRGFGISSFILRAVSSCCFWNFGPVMLPQLCRAGTSFLPILHACGMGFWPLLPLLKVRNVLCPLENVHFPKEKGEGRRKQQRTQHKSGGARAVCWHTRCTKYREKHFSCSGKCLFRALALFLFL